MTSNCQLSAYLTSKATCQCKMFYSSMGAEFLRICRAISKLEDFKITSSALIKHY